MNPRGHLPTARPSAGNSSGASPGAGPGACTHCLNLVRVFSAGVPMTSWILEIWSSSLAPGNSGCRLGGIKAAVRALTLQATEGPPARVPACPHPGPSSSTVPTSGSF